MTDEFGGIAVEEPTTDEFGGVLVSEPLTQPTQPVQSAPVPEQFKTYNPLRSYFTGIGNLATGAYKNLVKPTPPTETGEPAPSFIGRQLQRFPSPVEYITRTSPIASTVNAIAGAEGNLKQAGGAMLSNALKPMVDVPPEAFETAMTVLPNLTHFIPTTEETKQQLRRGVAESVKEGVADFMTSPAGAVSMGIGALPKLAQAGVSLAFSGMLASRLPERFYALKDAIASGNTQEITKQISSGIQELGLTALAGTHGTLGAIRGLRPIAPRYFTAPQTAVPPPIPVRPPPIPENLQQPTIQGGEIPNAIPERGTTPVPEGETPQNRQAVGQGVPEPGTPATAQAQRQAPEAPVPLTSEEQVIEQQRLQEALKPYMEEAPAEAAPAPKEEAPVTTKGAGVSPEQEAVNLGAERGQNVQVLDKLPSGKPFAKGQIATIGPNGEVLIARDQYNQWVNSKANKGINRTKLINSLLDEEGIHGVVTNEDAKSFFDNMTASEKALGTRIYTGKYGAGTRFTDAQLGHEFIRYKLQQLKNLSNRELVEATGREKFTVQIVSALQDLIFKIRSALGTKASKTQQELLDTYLKKLNVVRKSLKMPEVTEEAGPSALEKEEARRRVPKEIPSTPEAAMDFTKEMFPADLNEAITKWSDAAKQNQTGITEYAYEIGNKFKSSEDIAKLKAWVDDFAPKLRQEISKLPLEDRFKVVSLSQLPDEILHGAVKERPLTKRYFARPEETEAPPSAISKDFYDDLRKTKERLRKEHPYSDESLINTLAMDEMAAKQKAAKSEEAPPSAYRKPEKKEQYYRSKEIPPSFKLETEANQVDKALENLKKTFPNVKEADLLSLAKDIVRDRQRRQIVGSESDQIKNIYDRLVKEYPYADKKQLGDMAVREFDTGVSEEPTGGVEQSFPSAIVKPEREDITREWQTARSLEKYRIGPSEADDLLKNAVKLKANQKVIKYFEDLLDYKRLKESYDKELDSRLERDYKEAKSFSKGKPNRIEAYNNKLKELTDKTNSELESKRLLLEDVRNRFTGENGPGIANNYYDLQGLFETSLGNEFGIVNNERFVNELTSGVWGEKQAPPSAIAKPEREREPAPVPVTPTAVADVVSKTVQESKNPSFRAFVADAKDAFGKEMQPGQLREAWRDNVWQFLTDADGATLTKLRDKLGFRKSLDKQQRELGLEGIPDRRIDAPMAPDQRFRNRAIAKFGRKLLRQAEVTEEGLRRTSIEPVDVGWWRAKEGQQPVYRPISKTEAENPAELGKILTSGAAMERTGRNAPAESATKRVTAVVDTKDGRVHLLSTYRTGRGVDFIVDPIRIGKERPNVQVPALFGERLPNGSQRYRPIASVLLDEPVQNFKQTFKNLGEYREQFGDQVMGEAERIRGLPSPEEMAQPGVLRTGEPITDAEAKRLYDYFAGEELKEPADVQSSLESLLMESRPVSPETGQPAPLSTRQLAVVDALVKARDAYKNANPGMSEPAALDAVLNSIYETATNPEATRQGFVESLTGMARKGERPVEQGIPEAPPETGRELTMPISRRPPTATAEPLPKGPGPAPTYGAEESLPSAIAKEPRSDAVYRIRDIVPDVLRFYSEWMTERLARNGGPVAGYASRAFNRIISNTKKVYGSLTDVLDPALIEAGKNTKATRWINQLDKVDEGSAISRAPSALEGTIPIPEFAKGLVDLARAANLRIGQLYEPVIEGFKATGKFQRNLNAFGYDLIRRGRGAVWERLVKGNAEANGVPLEDAKAFFRRMKAVYDEPSPSTASIEKVNQDFARTFPKAITHVKVNTLLGPRWEPVLHSNLYRYLEANARRAAHIRAFREVFPVGNNRELRAVIRGLHSEIDPAYHKDIDATIRALQGYPSDTYAGLGGWLSPSEPIGASLRMFNQTVGNLMAKMVLTGQMFVQPGENIAGATPVFLGYRRYLKAMANLKQLYPELERAGARNRVIYDNSIDASARVRSAFRRAGNRISKGFAEQWLNELQEGAAAATARLTAEDIMAGRLSNWDRRMLPLTLEKMGFTKEQVATIMEGKSPDLLEQFVNKSAAWLTSGNKALAEGSRVGASRLFNSIFRFQSYAMAKTNQLRKVWGGLGKAVEEAYAKGDKQSLVRLRNEAEQFARYHFGATLQGALTVAITSLFYEKLFGLKIRTKEALEHPWRFLTESFLATQSGPFYLVWRAKDAGGLQGLSQQATRALFPYEITRNFMDMAQGGGYYRDMSLPDRVGKFVEQKIPASRAISSGLSLVGLSWENKDLETAARAFYRWRFNKYGKGGGPDETEEYKKRTYFRTHMKKAVEKLKKGDLESVKEQIALAAQAPNLKEESIARSLNARRILKTPNLRKLGQDEIDELRKEIGSQAVDKLIYFDAMIEALMEAYKE